MRLTSSRIPRWQRRALFNAPLHRRGELMAARLSEELAKAFKKRSAPVRKGDTVEIMRGDFAGHKEKITEVDRKKYRVYIKGVAHKNSKGAEKQMPVHPSNLRIIEMEGKDERRKKSLARK
jgi:large subunit ribosomal protein L24